MSLLLAASLIMTCAAYSTELSEADQKWAAAIEKMIAKDAERISTPDAKRAELAVKLAKKLNHLGRIEKNDTGYVVHFSAVKTWTEAKNDK